jgi:cell division protein FtsB
MMENEIDLAIVLQAMREQIGIMAQENAILKATIKKLENGPCNGYCSNTKDN